MNSSSHRPAAASEAVARAFSSEGLKHPDPEDRQEAKEEEGGAEDHVLLFDMSADPGLGPAPRALGLDSVLSLSARNLVRVDVREPRVEPAREGAHDQGLCEERMVDQPPVVRYRKSQ